VVTSVAFQLNSGPYNREPGPFFTLLTMIIPGKSARAFGEVFRAQITRRQCRGCGIGWAVSVTATDNTTLHGSTFGSRNGLEVYGGVVDPDWSGGRCVAIDPFRHVGKPEVHGASNRVLAGGQCALCVTLRDGQIKIWLLS
jgi:hypothetical protein